MRGVSRKRGLEVMICSPQKDRWTAEGCGRRRRRMKECRLQAAPLDQPTDKLDQPTENRSAFLLNSASHRSFARRYARLALIVIWLTALVRPALSAGISIFDLGTLGGGYSYAFGI